MRKNSLGRNLAASLATGLGIGILAVAPFIGVLIVIHEIIGHAHLPIELLHSNFGLVVMDAVVFAEYAVVMLPCFVWGLLVCTIGYFRLRSKSSKGSPLSALLIGLSFGTPLILIVNLMLETWNQRLLAGALFGLLFFGWGCWYLFIFRRLVIYAEQSSDRRQGMVNRRRFLKKVGALAGAFTLANSGIGYLWHRDRRAGLSEKMHAPKGFPDELVARIYPKTDRFQFPETQFSRHHPMEHPIGVCFSSGGPRSMSCAVGQMRGLREIGLLDKIGAVSSVSGSSWFASLFSFAPEKLSDDVLLGKVIPPDQITPQHLARIEPHMIASPLVNARDEKILRVAREIMRSISFSDSAAFNRFYSRLLGEILLKPFELDHHHRFFTLNDDSLKDILQRNPGLLPSHFYTSRKGRPFFIASGTQVYPLGKNQKMRSFEFTSLYAGMPQFFSEAGAENTDLGGGYIENIAFDSHKPAHTEAENLVRIPTSAPFFLLSDVIGSSSAGPGIALDYYNEPDLMAEFKLLPLQNQRPQSIHEYSIVDGASLEHHAILPLLHRQYPIILVFSNGLTPLGTEASNMIDGISIEISRLFGVNPKEFFYSQRDIQIFPKAQFAPLARGLKAARNKGGAPFYIDSYHIIQPNPFDIPAYPNGGKVTIVWFYNEVNQRWLEKLPGEVRDMLTRSDPMNRLDNFPFFKTTGQNHSKHGLPQLLYYSPEQINLLADMWSYNITHDARDALLTLRGEL